MWFADMKVQQQSNEEQKKYFGVLALLFDFFSLNFDKRFIKTELKRLRYKFFVAKDAQVQKSLSAQCSLYRNKCQHGFSFIVLI